MGQIAAISKYYDYVMCFELCTSRLSRGSEEPTKKINLIFCYNPRAQESKYFTTSWNIFNFRSCRIIIAHWIISWQCLCEFPEIRVLSTFFLENISWWWQKDSYVLNEMGLCGEKKTQLKWDAFLLCYIRFDCRLCLMSNIYIWRIDFTLIWMILHYVYMTSNFFKQRKK